MWIRRFQINPDIHDVHVVVQWMTLGELTKCSQEDGPPPAHLATWVKRLASDTKRRASRVEALMKAGGCQPCVRKVLDEAIDAWWVQGDEAVEVAFIRDTKNWHLPRPCPGFVAPVLTNARDILPDTKRLVMDFCKDFAVEVIELVD